MAPAARSVINTAVTIFHALFPAGRGAKKDAVPGSRSLEPRFLSCGFEPFVDGDGLLDLFLPGVLPAAAPFLLFRLKRTGFSRCRVEATGAGLFLTATR